MRYLSVILLFFSIHLAAQVSEVTSLMSDSYELLKKKKYSDAKVLLNTIIEKDPVNAEAYMLRGNINSAQEKYEPALADFEKALEIKPEYLEAIYGKALTLFFKDEIKEASDLIDDALKSHPDYASLYYCRGLIQNTREKYAKAIDDFNKAFDLEISNKFDLFLNRGVSYLNLAEYDNAREDLNKAIEMEPYNASAYHSRGRVLYELKEYENAVSDFQRSLELNPKNEVAFFNLGMAFYRMGKKTEACKNFHTSCSMKYENACRMIIMECSDNTP